MNHKVGPWEKAFFHGLSSGKKTIYKAFGLSLGVNRIWIKKNDHVPKSPFSLSFFSYMSKKGTLEKI